MLAQLAARLRARQGDAGGAGGEVVLGEDGETVLVDDNCTVSLGFFALTSPARVLTGMQIM